MGNARLIPRLMLCSHTVRAEQGLNPAARRCEILALTVFLLLLSAYAACFAIGLLLGLSDPSLYHYRYIEAYRSLKESPITAMYRLIFNELYEGAEFHALVLTLLLGLAMAFSRMPTALVPLLPSYSFMSDGVLSAPFSRVQASMLIVRIPMELSMMVAYALTGAGVVVLVYGKLKKLDGRVYIKYMVSGVSLLVISSLLEAISAVYVVLPIELLHSLP